MLLKYGHSLSPVRNWFIGNGLCSRLAYPTNLASDRTFTHYASSSYYDKLVKDANDLCVGLKYTNVANILTKFISSNHDTAVLKEIYPSSANNLDKVAEIDNCLTILQVCKILKFNDFDLISPLSESIRLCILKLSRDSGEHDVSGLAGAGIRPIIFAICKLFNDLGIMYDPLFLAISDIIHKEISVLNWDEINLLLSTYSNQKYNDVEIIGQIIKKISEDNLEGLSPNLAISLYSSLLFLECLSSAVKLKLEDRFIIRESDAIRFNEDLDITQLANIAYSNLLLNFLTSEDLNLITSSLSRTAELLGKSKGRDYDKKYSRQLTIIVSFLKCLYPNYYNTLSDEQKHVLMTVILSFDEYKSSHSTVFVDKVSSHLFKMKIRHDTNVYKNGLLLDIVEQDKNLVWLCNSYHRFYATTFNFTANQKLMIKLIKAFGYKLCLINYYQWGKMKCKRTRFAFLRMARYYALNDKREYDQHYAGWSLPYIWWNSKGRDQSHISLYEPNVP